MEDSRKRINGASILLIAGGLWPNVVCLVRDATLSPLDRALASAWCGGGAPFAEFLGHCPVCWGGMASFALAALMIWPEPVRARALR